QRTTDPSRIPAESTGINMFIPPALKKKEEERVKREIPSEVVEAYKNDPERGRFLLRKISAKLSSEGRAEDARKIESSAYIMDAQDRVSRSNVDKIEKNRQGIESGELKYDIESGQLVKPLGTLKSIVESYKQRTK